MSCKPTYKGKRYNSLEELYKANGVSEQQKQQAQQLYSSYLQTTNNPTIKGFKQWNNRQQQVNELFDSNETLANEVYEALGFETNNSLENKLKAFFNQFGFQYKEGESSTDLLNKIIYTSKKDNSVFIDNSVKALSQLLLANTNIDFHKLESLIEDTPEFKKLLSNSSDYLKTTHKFLKDGNRIPMEEWISYIKDYNKIKNEVLEKYLKESLLDNKNSTELHKLINDFLKWFKDLFANAKNLKDVTDSLIQQVLMNQKEVIINSKDLQNKERVTLAKALEETTHGKDIIKTFGDFGLILTGSVSAAEQGSVFRKTGKLLHDIDWVVPKGFTKDFNKTLKDAFLESTLVREFDSSTYYTQTYIVPPKGYTISNLTFFKPEVYGERKYIASYDVLDKNGNIVSNYRRYYDIKESGKVVENREVYNEGLKNVDKNLEAISVDFFQNKEDLKYEPYTVNIEGVNLQLSNWLSSFTEKLKYGRAKDLLDYANFIPNDVIPSITTITVEQKQQALEVYSQYLDTIFPDSKMKDIVYRGVPYKNANFDKKHLKPALNAFYFTDSVNEAKYYGSTKRDEDNNVLEYGTLFPAVLNIKNPYNNQLGLIKNLEDIKEYEIYYPDLRISAKTVKLLQDNNYDGYVTQVEFGEQHNFGQTQDYKYKVVFEPEQIHILSSKKDIEGFKEFVNNKSSQVENIEAQAVNWNYKKAGKNLAIGDVVEVVYSESTKPEYPYFLNFMVDGVPNINNEEKSLKLALKGLTPEEKISFCNHFGITMTEENGKKC